MFVRRGDGLERIGLKVSAVCGIERKTVRGETSWFEYSY